MATIPDLNEFMKRFVPNLDQRAHIDRKDAENWLAQVGRLSKSRPDAFDFHFRRLFGVGGSEIGSVLALVDEDFRKVFLFQTPVEIAQQKLMRQPPMEASSAMKAGIVFEDGIRRLFLEQSASEGVDLSPSEKAMRALAEHHRRRLAGEETEGVPRWMIGTPDDVFWSDALSGLVVVDYKYTRHCGREAPPIYVAQVGYYAMLLSKLTGVDEDRIVQIVAAYDPTDYRLYLHQVNHDPVLWRQDREKILAAGEDFWKAVLKGDLASLRLPTGAPRAARGEDATVSDQDTVTIAQASRKLATLLDERNALEQEIEQTSNMISEILLRTGNVGKVAGPIGDVLSEADISVSMRKLVDEKSLRELCERNVFQEDEVTKFSTRYDTQRLKEALRKQGIENELVDRILEDGKKRIPDSAKLEKALARLDMEDAQKQALKKQLIKYSVSFSLASQKEQGRRKQVSARPTQ